MSSCPTYDTSLVRISFTIFCRLSASSAGDKLELIVEDGCIFFSTVTSEPMVLERRSTSGDMAIFYGQMSAREIMEQSTNHRHYNVGAITALNAASSAR